MSDLADLLDEVLRLRREFEEHKVATRNMLRVGPVTERDHEKGVRIEHGTDEEPDRSPWVQPSERSGVERDLPRVGEQGMVLAPYGDPEQGQFIAFGHSDAKKNPAKDADETVHFERDGLRKSSKAGTNTTKTGKATVTTSPDTHGIKTEKAGHTTGPDAVTTTAGGSTHKVDQKSVIADASLFRATQKVFLASG